MTVRVQLLGKACAEVGEKAILFSPTLSFLTLAFLAYRNDWVNRDEVGFLFWSDCDTSRAQHNVRQLLKRLRKLPWLEHLETERYRLRWQVETDVAYFHQSLADENWQAAVATYRGTFLSGLDKAPYAEYASWLELARNRLREQWREALLIQCEYLERESRYDQACTLLKGLLTQDMLDEEAVRRYMELAARAGQRERALKTFRAFTEHLKTELDLEPTSQTKQLADTLRAEAFNESAAQARLSPSLRPKFHQGRSITVSSAFIGRDVELSEILHLLAKPDCRILTLVGFGGVGKSRLALKASEKLAPRYLDGVHFIPLEAVAEPDGIPVATATQLGLTLRGNEPPFQQVLAAIAKSRKLLVLDNFEHLLDGAMLITELVETCPNLDVITTSRERLKLNHEWLLPVEGLRFPGEAMMRENTLDYDAIKLFDERAKRVDPDFTLSHHLADVRTICELVEGLPLAIELAAVWVRTMPAADIARSIKGNLDFLENTNRDASGRHRGLRAIFAHSWERLSANEQVVLKKLSVFRGGFAQASASVVSGASVAVLSALIDKSLVRVTTLGRYQIHPLVYQFAREKLAEDVRQEALTRARHGRYYHTFVREAGRHLDISSTTALDEIAGELGNIRAAWTWALGAKDVLSLRASSETMGRFFDLRALFSEGLTWFLLVTEALDTDDIKLRAARGYARHQQAHFLNRLARYKASQRAAQEAVELLRLSGDKKGLVSAYLTLGYTARTTTGKADERAAYLKALPIARSLDDPTMLIRVLNGLGISPGVKVGEEDEDLERSKVYLSEGLTLSYTHENLSMRVVLLGNLGYVYLGLGNYQRARHFLEESLELARTQDTPMWVVNGITGLATIAYELGDLGRARTLCDESLELADEYVLKQQCLEPILLSGELLLKANNPSGAQAEMVQALRLAWSYKDVSFVLEALRLRAKIGMAKGKTQFALRQMAFVVKSMDLNHYFLGRLRNRQLWNTYSERFSAEAVRKAETYAKTLELADVVRAALADDEHVASPLR